MSGTRGRSAGLVRCFHDLWFLILVSECERGGERMGIYFSTSRREESGNGREVGVRWGVCLYSGAVS